MPATLAELTESLRAGNALDAPAVEAAAAALLSPENDDASKADFLKALAAKGETETEIALFVEAFLNRAVDPCIHRDRASGPMIDVCGTGGDRLDLFNVSTAGMFLLAAGGAVVVKHGNRSISSQCGGADVLEALGIQIDLPPEEQGRRVERDGLGFLFAAHYHPTFRAIVPVRKMLAAQGCTSIFNLLGPLLNPARPDYQLVGLFSKAALPKYAAVLRKLGRKHAWAVHGTTDEGTGMDEVSSLGETTIHAVTPEGVAERAITGADLASLGLAPASLADLRGGTREENARILLGILDGSLKGPKRDLVCLNAAAGFVVTRLAADLAAGFALAQEQIDSGRALGKLRAMQAV